MDRTSNGIVIAINDAYLLAPWSLYFYFCDAKWHAWHRDKPQYVRFPGTKITQDEVNDPSCLRVRGEHHPGLSEDPSFIHFGMNSGFQALNLAVLFGASRVLLIGYDMKYGNDGRSHWFGEHPDKVRSNYDRWISNFAIAREQCDRLGVEVINCSPDTNLTCFHQASLASVL